ncbi:MAG: hypothetical protein WAR79_00040 [Melioribacteraceae bacterium]
MIINEAKSKSKQILKKVEQGFNNSKVKTNDILQSGEEKIETETGRLKSSVKDGIDAYNKVKNS